MLRFYAGFGAILTICFMLSQPTQGDWSENFNGGFQQTWIFGNVNGVGTPSGSFTSGIVADALQLQDLTPAAAGGAAIGFGFVNQAFTDVTASALLNPASQGDLNRDVGLAVRANFATLSGYTMSVNFGTGAIDLSRAINGSTTGLGSGTISITPSTPVIVELSAFGSTVSGRVSSLGGATLGELSATDATFATGVSGVIVSTATAPGPASPLRGSFDNVSVVAIPEPTSLGLVSLLAASAFVSRRKRSSL